ncbi:TPR repeat-containing thioredoxin TDX [Aristolochia californica]|uniref:TPR repeat-containing thioredoxin TDX n=1 Tax=Aristolochia californica TaxID=171875 RepID=UPI0035D7406A
MDAAKIEQLKLFVNQCKLNPSILEEPFLDFFKDYLLSLGGQIPSYPKKESTTSGKDFDDVGDADINDEIVESDIELDGEIVEDNDPPQQMGDSSVEITEEKRDAAQVSKAKAMDALSEGKVDEAIVHLTEAIMTNPSSAILYAARAAVFVKMNKPNAAIRDAEAALKINPDSAKGYKTRGMARAQLGQWEEAAKDLHLASKLDYDDEINSVLKKVEPNVQKIEEHRRKYERLRKEREKRKFEYERKHQQAEAKRHSEAHSAAALQEGSVISILSASELDTKFKAASSLSWLAIMYFTASWCGPCRIISPLYTSLAEKYPKVVFLKIDIDEVRSVAAQWNVSSVPTFFFIKDGKEVDRVVGADKNGLERKISQYAGQS